MFIEIRIAACAAMLIASAIIDIRKREIPDKIWLGFGGFGLLLTALEFSFQQSLAPISSYVLGIGIITPIAFLVYRTGLFGGADSKALIAIAVLFPWFNEGIQFKIHDFPAFTVLTNALLISMSQLAFNAVRNLMALAHGRRIFDGIEESATRKVLAFATGYSTNSSSGYLFPMEMIDESGKRKFVFNPARYEEFLGEDIEQSNQQGQQLSANLTSHPREIWVTQALPFIVYLAIGFVLAITVGDLLGAIIRNVVGFPL